MGHRVIVPSTVGYCDSESPLPLEYYTLKRIATDLVALLSSIGISKAIYFGHDWGSIIVQRVTFWFPEHVLAVGLVCVPWTAPLKEDIPLTEIVKRRPSFAYQLWFASQDAERKLSSPQAIEKFLKAIFRIKGDPPVSWNTGKDMMQAIGDPSLGKVWENQDVVWEYYLRSFTRTGSLRGPLNYYKTRELNFRDELELLEKGKDKVSCPSMFIGAMEDRALPPSTWKGQEWVPQLEQYTVSQGHWCLVENGGQEIQPIIQKWVAKVSKSAQL